MAMIFDPNDLDNINDFILFKDVEAEIVDYVEGRKHLIEAETTHFFEYDNHWRWLRGEITGFGGIPNHGKSKWVIFLTALKMFYSKWKVAVYSPETTPAAFFFGNYIHTFTSYNLFSKSRKPNTGEIRKFKNILDNQLFLCEPEKMPTFQGIMERFTKAYEMYGVDVFVIDPFNCLDREWEYSKRDDRYVGEFLDHYKDFVKKTNTCGLVVMHPNSGIKIEKGGMDYECPNMYNLAGGAMWGNKLDNLTFVHRPKFISDRADSTVLIRHSKIKKREIVGMGGDVNVEFNFLTNRYSIGVNAPEFDEKQSVAEFNEAPF
jgi:twinkle protein